MANELLKALGINNEEKERETALPGTLVGRPVEQLEEVEKEQSEIQAPSSIKETPKIEKPSNIEKLIEQVKRAENAWITDDIPMGGGYEARGESKLDFARGQEEKALEKEALDEMTPLERKQQELLDLQKEYQENIKSARKEDSLMKAIELFGRGLGNVSQSQAMTSSGIPQKLVADSMLKGMGDTDYAKQVQEDYTVDKDVIAEKYKDLLDAAKKDTEKPKYFSTKSGVVAVDPNTSEVKEIYKDPLAKKAEERAGKREVRLGDKFEWQKEEKNELSDKQVEQIAGYDQAIQNLEQALNIKLNEDIDTGPLTAMFQSMGELVGGGDTNILKIKSYLGETLAQTVRNLSGTAASDREREFIAGITVPNISDNDEQFKVKLKTSLEKIKKARDLRLKAIKKEGKAPQTQPTSKTTQKYKTGDIKNIDGKQVKYSEVTGQWHPFKE
jgi:hypothetical protein